jgi:FtsH-binding integral membrane protein
MADYRTLSGTQARVEVVNAFMRGVYGWMTAGLALTGGVAYLTAGSEAMRQMIFGNQLVLIALIIAQLGIVVGLSAAVNRLSAGTATGLFLAYSALTGLTLSAIFLAYPPTIILKAFLTAAGMFGAMSIYGLTTKRDLTSMGSFLTMGLFGLIIAMVVNIFLNSSMMDFVISGVGVILFTGLTAYDTQRLSTMGSMAPGDATVVRRGTILGALTLYLDFINLFLMLLRLFSGSSRD